MKGRNNWERFGSILFLYIYNEKVLQIWLDRFVFFNKLQLRERQKPFAVLDVLLHISAEADLKAEKETEPGRNLPF